MELKSPKTMEAVAVESINAAGDTQLMEQYLEVNACHLRQLHEELSRLELPPHSISRILGIPARALLKCQEKID